MRLFIALAALALAACSSSSDSGAPASGGSAGAAVDAGGGVGGVDAASGGHAGTGGAAGAAGSATVDSGTDAGFVDPVASAAPAVKVAGGFQFVEGPAWHDGTLYFSDIPADRIYQLTPPGGATVYREPSGQSNGLAFDAAARLVACEHAGRRVSRTLTSSTVETVAGSWQSKQLNSPNDFAIRSDGTIYFTDPPYGGNPNELGFQGVFRIDPGGTLHLESDDMFRPNGAVLSPSELVLYVSDSEQHYVRRYDVAVDGTLANPSKLVDTSNTPDGMTVDAQGDLYVATSMGIEVYLPDGSLLGTLPVPEQPANVTFGGANGSTLYVTAQTSVYSIELAVPGAT